MKYKFKKTPYWHELHTDFEIQPGLANLIKCCKGVEWFSRECESKYRASLKIGKMFSAVKVKQDISKIIDAYIESNPDADKREENAVQEFAEQNGMYRFLSKLNKN